MHDGVSAPKVINFGIAKATQGRLTEQTLVTGLEQFMGTPACMSPEQAERRDLDIDTPSDVYSLGVVLYELLTGRTPHDPQLQARADIDEIRRIIREVDPPRLSARVSTLNGADRATVARLRGAEPLQLTSVLRGDLDWIVMRSLEKERNRRYGTAHELTDDVHRHLRQEPVDARPPHRLYRAQKFAARNRLTCAGAAAIAEAARGHSPVPMP
jgi:serine/threonine protein kinase